MLPLLQLVYSVYSGLTTDKKIQSMTPDIVHISNKLLYNAWYNPLVRSYLSMRSHWKSIISQRVGNK